MSRNAVGALPMSDQFLQLAEAAVALMPRARGRRRVKVLARGKKWVMYMVTTSGRIKVRFVDWREWDFTPYSGYAAHVVINLDAGCVAYRDYNIYAAYRLTERDIAGLMTAIGSVKGFLDYIWRRIKEEDEREPCEWSPLFL